MVLGSFFTYSPNQRMGPMLLLSAPPFHRKMVEGSNNRFYAHRPMVSPHLSGIQTRWLTGDPLHSTSSCSTSTGAVHKSVACSCVFMLVHGCLTSSILFKYERSRGHCLFWVGPGYDGLLGGVLFWSDVLWVVCCCLVMCCTCWWGMRVQVVICAWGAWCWLYQDRGVVVFALFYCRLDLNCLLNAFAICVGEVNVFSLKVLVLLFVLCCFFVG